MTKKFGLFVLSFIAIFGIGVSFADVVDPGTHYVNRCVKFQNVEIDNYRLIVVNDTVTSWDAYEPSVNECLRGHYHFGESRQYLLDKSIDIEEINQNPFLQPIPVGSEEVEQPNIFDEAIQIGSLNVNGYYVSDSNPLTRENLTYKIVKNGDGYELEELDVKNDKVVEDTDDFVLDNRKQDGEMIENNEVEKFSNDYFLELVETEQGIDVTSGNRIMKFGIARLLTILIETIVLFVVAKLFRKEDHISNWKLILVGIIASTVTLPLLWFVFPLFLGTGELYVVVGELSVTLIEIFIIKYGLKVSRGKAIIASIACNLCSYLIGTLIF